MSGSVSNRGQIIASHVASIFILIPFFLFFLFYLDRNADHLRSPSLCGLVVMIRLVGGVFRGGLVREALRSLCSSAADETMAKGKFFYAVRKGFTPGVYASWWVME